MGTIEWAIINHRIDTIQDRLLHGARIDHQMYTKFCDVLRARAARKMNRKLEQQLLEVFKYVNAGLDVE